MRGRRLHAHPDLNEEGGRRNREEDANDGSVNMSTRQNCDGDDTHNEEERSSTSACRPIDDAMAASFGAPAASLGRPLPLRTRQQHRRRGKPPSTDESRTACC
jgi:hypothetical protein